MARPATYRAPIDVNRAFFSKFLEIERRVAAIESGAVKLEPWDDVKRRIEKEILGR